MFYNKTNIIISGSKYRLDMGLKTKLLKKKTQYIDLKKTAPYFQYHRSLVVNSIVRPQIFSVLKPEDHNNCSLGDGQ